MYSQNDFVAQTWIIIALNVRTHWQVPLIDLLLSLQQKNLPWNNCTAITAKIKWNSMYTINMFMTFFKELTTQSKTALSLGTRLMVFNGRNTLSTRSDLIVDKFVPTVPPLKYHTRHISNILTKCICNNGQVYTLIVCKQMCIIVLYRYQKKQKLI